MFPRRFREMRIGFEIRQAQQCFIIFELKFEPIVKSSFRVRIPFPSLRKALRRATTAAAGRNKWSKAPRSCQGTAADSPAASQDPPCTQQQKTTKNNNNLNINCAQQFGQISATNLAKDVNTSSNLNSFALPNNQRTNNSNGQQPKPSYKESKKRSDVRKTFSSPKRKLERHTVGITSFRKE